MKKTFLALAAAAVLPLFAAETVVNLESGKEFAELNDFRKTVTIQFEKFMGKQAVVVRGREEKLTRDTAFSIRVKQLSVAGKKSLKVSADAACTHAQLFGKNSWCCQIVWYDNKGKALPGSPMHIKFVKNEYKTYNFTFKVPETASTAFIQFGCDLPDFSKNDFLAISRIAYTLE